MFDLIAYPVKNVEKAKRYYRALLGVDPYVDSAWYIGFRTGDMELGLVPSGHDQGLRGPLPYRTVPDINAALKTLTDAGGTVAQEPRDVAQGLLIAWVKDADGNLTGLRQNP